MFIGIILPDKFQEINNTVFSSSSSTLTTILAHWPNILAALGIILVGWLMMRFINMAIIKIAKKISLPVFSQKIGFTAFLEKAQVKSPPSEVIADFLGGYVFTMFFLAATKVVNLTAVSNFLESIITYIPNIAVALFIILVGNSFGDTVKALVETTMNVLGSGGSKILGIMSKNIIVLFAILAALLQLNIADDLVKILFIGVVAMLSLAGALAIGLGSKDIVKEILEEIKNQKS